MTSADFDGIAIDGDILCTFCAEEQNIDIDNDPEVSPMFCDGESDTPQNCGNCHRPISYGLTQDGFLYVVGCLRDELRKGADEYLKINNCYKGSYYEGSPHIRIILDWLKSIWFINPGKRFIEKCKDHIYYMAKKRGVTI